MGETLQDYATILILQTQYPLKILSSSDLYYNGHKGQFSNSPTPSIPPHLQLNPQYSTVRTSLLQHSFIHSSGNHLGILVDSIAFFTGLELLTLIILVLKFSHSQPVGALSNRILCPVTHVFLFLVLCILLFYCSSTK